MADRGSRSVRRFGVLLLGMALIGGLWLGGPNAGARSGGAMSLLDNGTIRVGVDLSEGGVITYLSRSDAIVSVINDFDLGRQVQQSYYAGPQPYGISHPAWPNVPWNPIGAGDVYGNPSQVVSFSNDGREIFVKSVPKQWALDDVPCECTFEHWITLEGNAVRVRNRLTTFRADKTLYQGYGQELPAVYTTGRYSRIITYTGAAPFTGGPLTEVAPSPVAVAASEHWVALVDVAGFGLGVFNPDVTHVLANFFGQPCDCGPKDNPTGYLGPWTLAIIDPDAVYEYRYDLVLGTIAQIREQAVANRPPDRLPAWGFERGRQGWTYANAVDIRYPADGALHVSLERGDPSLIAPQQTWQAKDVPRIYLRAAVAGSDGDAQVFWTTAGAGEFTEEESVRFSVIPDGRFHTYAVDLAASPRYRGPITWLRLDPSNGGVPGASLDLDWVSWQTVRHPRTVTLMIAGRVATGRVTVTDQFTSCRAVPVRIERRTGGRWQRVAAVTAGAAGGYRVVLRRGNGPVRAVAPEVARENEICSRAVSTVRRS